MDATLVKTKSPVEDTASYLYKWDSSVRQSFWAFEANISMLRQGISALYRNPFTSFRDETQFGHHYNELEQLRLRQKLGRISDSELKEINSHSQGYSLSLVNGGADLPSKLYATHDLSVGGSFAACGALAGYAKFVKGYNVLWLAGAFVPFLGVMLWNHVKQPETHLNNMYSYLIAKRLATVEL